LDVFRLIELTQAQAGPYPLPLLAKEGGQRKGKGMVIDLNRSTLFEPLLKDETLCTLKMFLAF
jgi:hypothetical protein